MPASGLSQSLGCRPGGGCAGCVGTRLVAFEVVPSAARAGIASLGMLSTAALLSSPDFGAGIFGLVVLAAVLAPLVPDVALTVELEHGRHDQPIGVII